MGSGHCSSVGSPLRGVVMDQVLRGAMLGHKYVVGYDRGMSELGHVWTAPTGQGIFGFLLAVGCKSCVRPVCAALMTAGPDVIRRSGPYQDARARLRVTQ